MLENELVVFFIYVISGMAISIFFDIFRVLRKTIRTSNIVTYLEDAIFWIVVGIFLIWEIFTVSYGELRSYIFIGLLIGFAFYMLTLSKHFININVKILNKIKRIVLAIINVIKNIFQFIVKIIRPILIVLKKPICFLFINFKNIEKKLSTKTKLVKSKINNRKKKFFNFNLSKNRSIKKNKAKNSYNQNSSIRYSK